MLDQVPVTPPSGSSGVNRLLPLRPGTGPSGGIAVRGLPSALSWVTGSGAGEGKAPPPPGTGSPAAQAEGGIGQARVLIVEDEMLVAWEVSDMLGTSGHLVCGIAATAEEAVRLAAEQRPDLILMDVTLKGPRDGIEAATAIQASQPARILYVTAHSDPATRARMEATAPIGILHKPYAEGDLERAIAMALVRQ